MNCRAGLKPAGAKLMFELAYMAWSCETVGEAYSATQLLAAGPVPLAMIEACPFNTEALGCCWR